MLVLHGFWSASNGLCLWAEDSELTVKSPSQALRAARPHPFAAPAGVLAGIHAGKPGDGILLLPSLRMSPLDSPELVREEPPGPARGAVTLAPWQVPALELDPDAALGLLWTLGTDRLALGATARHLREVHTFAADLVARGRLLPSVDLTGPLPRAVWRPVLTDLNSPVGAGSPHCHPQHFTVPSARRPHAF